VTTNQILFELAAQGCRCDKRNGNPERLCDPCVADNALRQLEQLYRETNEQLVNPRAAVACEITADYIRARDSDDMEIPACEEDED
jgi:hypothetical protein